MGRPEPCVLFAQTFVHPQLNEYVDEVIFAEPIVITACEILEHSASSASQAVTLIGATSPPSFALEVFVQCEKETRFRRLCQSFLYSHSSSNLLEVEAVVTSHLVVRGSYRNLSLVIYGNTAEDLGQFNIKVDIDSSLTKTVSSVEGKLEDLPPALRPSNRTLEELLVSSPKVLSLEVVRPDISAEMKQLLQLSFKILRFSDFGDGINQVIKFMVAVASSYARHSCCRPTISQNKILAESAKISEEEFHSVIAEARKELSDIYVSYQRNSPDISAEYVADNTLVESETDLATSKQLADILSEHVHFEKSEPSHLSMNKSIILWSSAALLLCSSRESCFHFVNSGGMEKLCDIFCKDSQNSHAVTLILLGVVEQATRHSIGCEGFLGWWPREDESVPSGTSKGYSTLLRLLMQKQPHDVAFLATLILQRLRFYEVASRYESAVLSVLGSLLASGKVTSVTLDKLTCARFQLKALMKLINSRSPVEDPSLLACASRSLLLGEAEGILSYESTSSLITSSNCRFSVWDIDSHLLSLLKERGFFTLSAALFSSPVLRADTGQAMDLFVDVTSYLETITLSLLFCRSGLIFLLIHPELSTTIVLALKAADNLKEEAAPLRYASLLISKGFFRRPEEIGVIIETYLRVVNAVDRLLASDPQSDEILWVLWDLCRLSRSHCGREALLALGYFPEALSVLIAALHSMKELDPVTSSSATSPLNLAVVHSAAEIFEVIVTDLTASSLGSWIGKAMELYRALHSSSPGSNRKDAPTRLLELIDATAVYHKKGGSGLLQYAAVLASGLDSNAALASVLPPDMMDIENITTESSTNADSNPIENLLGKPIFENSFRATGLRDSSVAQLTTAFRILASISENSAVAATLYNEGAVMVIHAVLIDCIHMLERSSNNYDYLVDEGTEGNSTSDLLLERNREQGLVDLLITSLVLLISLLQRLKEAREQHRNTKLMKALMQLHREMSPRLAACAADLSSPYPSSALGFEAVCHLLVSALACWPVHGWAPGLFSFLVDSLHATSLLTLGPKDACSFLCLLNDLFPEEGFWLWKNGMPMLSALRKLAVGTLLGPQKEKEIGWYLQPQCVEVLLGQLTPKIEKIALIVLQCAVSALVVIQDLLRVFVIRIACLNSDHACILLRPIISTIHDRISESSLSDTEAYKVFRLLEFLAAVLEHPFAKPLLLKEGAVQILIKVLEKCTAFTDAEGALNVPRCGFSQLSWCVPVLKSLSLIGDSRSSMQHPVMSDRQGFENITADDCSRILSSLLKLCKVLPVGRELFACLSTFNELGSFCEGKSAMSTIFLHIQSCNLEESGDDGRRDMDGSYKLLNPSEWKKSPPLLACWITLLRSLDSKDIVPEYAIEAVGALSSGSLQFCKDGKSLNMERVAAVKYLFGLPFEMSASGNLVENNIKYIEDLVNLLCSKVSEEEYPVDSDTYSTLYQVHISVKSLLSLLQKPIDSVDQIDIETGDCPLAPNGGIIPSKMHKIADGSARKAEDYNLGALVDNFLWECPENLPSLKRKMTSLEAGNRRQRGDSVPSDSMAQTTFSRGSVPLAAPSGPTRRDNFRQRKPNSSRPPSMHVDDYVARERNADGTSSSNVIAVQRMGSSSGRPPSIHVDEFEARQRERQNPLGVGSGDAVAQVKNTTPKNDTTMENSNKPQQIKTDLDDDLQGIDIVFDGEESESDDKLPFPQPDDNLTQPAPVVVEQNSPHSIVEETESDVNSSSQFSHIGAPNAANVDENTQSEFSSRMSVSRPEKSLNREPSISSERKYYDKSDDSKNAQIKTSGGFNSDGIVGPGSTYPGSAYNRSSVPHVHLSNDSRMHQPYNSKNNLRPIGSQGIYDHKFQPPLPPMPPPATIVSVTSQTLDNVASSPSPFRNSMADLQASGPPGFHGHSDYMSAPSKSSTTMVSSSPMPDPKYSRGSHSSPGGSRPPPPLPPTPPPPFLTSNLGSSKQLISPSSRYNQTGSGAADFQQASGAPSNDPRLNSLSASGGLLTSYPPPMMPPLFNRPSSVPGSIYGSNPASHHGENLTSMSQNLPVSLSSIQSIQSLGLLQPLQPPQIIRPPQPPQHLRPPIPASPQSEQSLLQSPVQMQLQQLQMLQQPQVSPFQVYYQPPQQENISNPPQQQQQQLQVGRSRHQPQHLVGDGTSQQQDDPGMTLQHYFSSPEAIQSLLSDRDKLCQLLEEHPKLMQMLQERLPH